MKHNMGLFDKIFSIGIVQMLFCQYYETEQGIAVGFTPHIVIPSFILLLLVGYLLGSLNFALIVSKKMFDDDVRTHGSGNAGMTNMMRTYGKKAAALTLSGDALKAVVSVMLGILLMGIQGAFVAGLGCFIGHTWPLYYKFHGGKGVVTAITLVLCTTPVVGLILLLFFIIIVGFTKYISLGSVMCALIYPLIMARMTNAGIVETVCGILMAVLIVFNHRENIKRLYSGKENKFSFSKKEKKDDASKSEK